MSADLFVDLSSNNPLPDLKTLWAAGERVLVVKATEGTSYAWSNGTKLADAWHKMGPAAEVWFYHFAHAGNAKAQATYFLNHVAGHTRPGDRLVLDCEVAGVDGAFEDVFMGAVHAASPLGEEIYGSPYFIRDHGITPRHGEGLWLAQYAQAVSFIPTGWRTYDAWQKSQTAHVAGVSGAVDLSVVGRKTNPYPAAVIPFDARKGKLHNPRRVKWVQWALGRPLTGLVNDGDRAALLAFKRTRMGQAHPDLIIRQPCGNRLAAVTRRAF